jgi:hypothetical protein
MEPMSTPQTTSTAASSGTNGVNGAFPADVVAFAAANKVEDCLQPLLEATHRIFPTARFVKVEIDDDPELRDQRHILYNVQVAGLSLEESRAAGSGGRLERACARQTGVPPSAGPITRRFTRPGNSCGKAASRFRTASRPTPTSGSG